jgi:hypothetical protein
METLDKDFCGAAMNGSLASRSQAFSFDAVQLLACDRMAARWMNGSIARQ